MTVPNNQVPRESYPKPLPFSTTTVGAQVIAGDALLTAYSLTETTGKYTAQVEIFDASGTGGQSVRVVNIAPGQTVADDLGPLGCYCRSGVFVAVNSGTVRGSCVVVDL